MVALLSVDGEPSCGSCGNTAISLIQITKGWESHTLSRVDTDEIKEVESEEFYIEVGIQYKNVNPGTTLVVCGDVDSSETDDITEQWLECSYGHRMELPDDYAIDWF